MTEKPAILQRDNPILREKAATIAAQDIGSDRITGIIAAMKKALSTQKDGIAIAAPQIGESVRIFVVSGDLLKEADKTYKGEDGSLVFINPEITRRSRDKKEMEEGCLSVRWLYGKVKRSTRVSLKALNEKGEKIDRGASGLLAQIFQHEVDHLDGKLFTDIARETWEMSPEEIAEVQK
ncbi:MAG: peptide deformylase, peptide deformylase [Candidatus Parcubacteria bacterium]|nr:peptide deformylase, peptide deformylase [Candidatus Parcubacteria bacterium]